MFFISRIISAWIFFRNSNYWLNYSFIYWIDFLISFIYFFSREVQSCFLWVFLKYLSFFEFFVWKISSLFSSRFIIVGIVTFEEKWFIGLSCHFWVCAENFTSGFGFLEVESEPGDDGLKNAYLSAWELREAQKYEQWVSGSRDPFSADTRTSLNKGEDRAGLRKVVRICGPLTCPA